MRNSAHSACAGSRARRKASPIPRAREGTTGPTADASPARSRTAALPDSRRGGPPHVDRGPSRRPEAGRRDANRIRPSPEVPVRVSVRSLFFTSAEGEDRAQRGCRRAAAARRTSLPQVRGGVQAGQREAVRTGGCQLTEQCSIPVDLPDGRGRTFPMDRSIGHRARPTSARRSERTPVLTEVNEDGTTPSGGSLLDEIPREGARRMPAAALEAEVNAYTAELSSPWSGLERASNVGTSSNAWTRRRKEESNCQFLWTGCSGGGGLVPRRTCQPVADVPDVRRRAPVP